MYGNTEPAPKAKKVLLPGVQESGVSQCKTGIHMVGGNPVVSFLRPSPHVLSSQACISAEKLVCYCSSKMQDRGELSSMG